VEKKTIVSYQTIPDVASKVRDFYLERGYSDKKYLESFEKWYLDNLDNKVQSIEDCFLVTLYVSVTMLEENYALVKLLFLISLGVNFYFAIRGLI
jgi:hypothetical protein